MKSARPRAVIDTNVLLDFWVFDDPAARPLREAVLNGAVQAVRSGECVDELSEVLTRTRFDLPAERRLEILRLWDRLACPVERVQRAPLECTDPRDQKFLDLACSSAADWLVTKDKTLLKLARKALAVGLQVIGPAQAGGRLTVA